YGTFDFVIVGGGVTGSVLASRLSEIEEWSVLVLEAGKFVHDEFLQFMPYLYHYIHSEYNWGYKSVPQKTSCLGTINQQCLAHRGKGMGGSSLLNAAKYHHGASAVFNKWGSLLEDPTWTYCQVLPLFKESENFHRRNPRAPIDMEYHGTGGYLDVEQRMPEDELAKIILRANDELGYHFVDYNSPTQIGASIVQQYTKDGCRQDVASAFLQPVLNRTNLKILTESYVTKINIDNNTKSATGVTFAHNGTIYSVQAKKEVILSAGTFSSAQILMLSGIGPKAHLEKIGVEVIEDLEVGSAMHEDSLCQDFYFTTNLTKPDEPLEKQVRDFLNGYGALRAIFGSQAIGFYRTSLEKSDITDLEFNFVIDAPAEIARRYTGLQNSTYTAAWGFNYTNVISVSIYNINTKSSGTVRLKSVDPFDYPLLNFSMLSDPQGEDIAVMYEGIQLILKIAGTEPFQKIGARYAGSVVPGCESHEFLSKEYWYCFLRQTTVLGQHATGTCPMGVDPQKGAVVNSKLEVIGIKKLRVADASVFPTSIAGHVSATCMMIGQKLSASLKTLYSGSSRS
ncbi:Glucose dehydrogenase, partial [Gonioctena quinquepunctata]